MANIDANLVWSPIGPQIVSRCGTEGGLRLLIAPFIQREALVHLLDKLTSHEDLKIITRWTAKDIAAGVSDPFVYEECANRHIPLYLHPAIHLKMFTMGSGLCFCGSANVTSSGLGLHEGGNIEAGIWSAITLADWQHVYDIINASLQTDNATFEAAVRYRDKYLHHGPPLPPLELPTSVQHDFTLASLPSTNNPEDVILYESGGEMQFQSADINCIMHDLVAFGGIGQFTRDKLQNAIREGFLSQLFVKQIIDHIKQSGSLRFGEMTAWIHSNCRDVPVPYRWEIKESTHVLYNWLEYYVPEISWSVPGQRSQVIVWKSMDK